MSTIVTSNISDGTTTVGTEYVVNGSAKAWVNFDGTGTIAIRDSLNVASLTDGGIGYYTVNTVNAMGSVGYVTTTEATLDNLSGSVSTWMIGLLASSGTPILKTTSSAQFRTSSYTGVTRDASHVGMVFHGDLA